jgi:predicted metal-dependent phosphotriesterase family hydrolase
VIHTVCGPIEDDELGFLLPHEHLVVDHSEVLGRPAALVDDDTIQRVVDALSQAYTHGVRTIVDCTPPRYGRYLDLMAEVSRRTGVHIVAATGSFCESWGPLPPAVTGRSVEELADGFCRELTESAGSTRLRAGVIKAATSPTITPAERKVLLAAGRASARTGAAIVSHTSGGEGTAQLDIYEAAGTDPARVMISHVGLEADPLSYALQLLARGVWIGLDKIGRHVPDDHWSHLVLGLRDAGHLDRVLLSHDVVQRFTGPEHVAAATFEDYSYLPRVFLPKLAAAGLSPAELEMLTVHNPRRWLSGEEERT